MMLFGQPYALLLLIPAAAGLGFELWRRGAIVMSFPKVARVWAGHNELSFGRHGVGGTVRWRLWSGLALLALALAQPRWGMVEETVYDPARDVVVAMDLSRSMLAKDVRPSRLEHAQLLVLGMLDKLVGVRVGLVPFAGVSFVQLPLSLDYNILIETMGTLSPDNFPRSGTNFTAMLSTALEAFSEETSNDRYLIIISDGESSDGGWRELAPKLKERGIRVIAVSVGTATGAVIPAKNGDVMRDANGAEVLSRFSPTFLENLAEATGGIYLNGNSYVALSDTIEDIATGSANRLESDRGEERLAERYQWFLLPAILLLLASYWIEVPYRPHARNIELPETPVEVKKRSNLGAGITALFILALLTLALPRAYAIDESENAVGPGKRPSSPVDAQAYLIAQRIEQILAHGGPNAIDCASYVIDSIGYLETKLRIREKPPLSVLKDTLAAIDTGRKLDPEAADWTKFQSTVEDMLRRTLEPAKVYAAQSAENVDLETLLAMADEEQKKDRTDRNNQDQDDDMEIPDDLLDRPSRKVAGSAFGDLMTDAPPPAEPAAEEAEPARKPRPNRFFGQNKPITESDLALPLHRLAQIQSQDSPARLYQLMEGDDLPPPVPGDDW